MLTINIWLPCNVVILKPFPHCGPNEHEFGDKNRHEILCLETRYRRRTNGNERVRSSSRATECTATNQTNS